MMEAGVKNEDLMEMVWTDKNVSTEKPYCVCCGKLLKGDNNRMVEVVGGGSHAVRPGAKADAGDPGYMGFYDVGPDCAKKYLPNFTHPSGE
jgi:hypothetical protein